MKGKQLTLEEVLNLEDGSVVWVEDSRKHFNSELCEFRIDGSTLDVINDKTCYDLNNIRIYEGKITFYEWIENELVIPDKIKEPYYSQSVVESMANEIARHRYPNKYEYDDELIDNIIKEFS